ncbi:MAG: ComEC/Rec2 family competence protein, partial [Firmicutes bacterium]|nr:ComEC/Rec2 family competence protein [Bacillota bacterium]
FFPDPSTIAPGSWDAVYAYLRRVPPGPFAVTLHRQGILVLATASLYSVSVVDAGSPLHSVNVLYGSGVAAVSGSLVASYGQGPAAWILAIAAGDHTLLDAGVVKTLAGLGMVHALIASGATVTMLVVPLVRTMRRSGAGRRGRWYIPALVLLAAMAVYSGFSLPALRAIVAYTYRWTAEVCGFSYDSWAAFALSALALTLWQPDAALDPGVLLSFVAVGVLARMTPALDSVLPSRWPHWARNVIARGLAAELGLTPLIADLFAQFSLLSLGINLFLYPLLELAIPVCFALVLLGVFLPQVAATLSPALTTVANGLNQGIRTLGQGSFVLRVSHVTYTDVLLYYVLVWGTYRVVHKYANQVRRRYF